MAVIAIIWAPLPVRCLQHWGKKVRSYDDYLEGTTNTLDALHNGSAIERATTETNLSCFPFFKNRIAAASGPEKKFSLVLLLTANSRIGVLTCWP